MNPNTTPRFPGQQLLAAVAIATANTNRDGTGTVPTLVTAGSQDAVEVTKGGSVVTMIRYQATVTTTVGVVRVFLHNGVAFFLLKEMLVPARVPSTTVEAASGEFVPTEPIKLPPGWSIRVSTHNAENFNVFAFGGHF